MANNSAWLVESDWLLEHLDTPDIVVLDASWHLPPEGRDAYREYLDEHIPGAIFFDIDNISDTDSELPHMLPAPVQFSSHMRKMGIGDGSQIIVYDSKGLFSAARVWWTFRVMGKIDVCVLNGGLRKWKAEGKPLQASEPAPRTSRHFTSRLNRELLKELDDILTILDDNSAQIIDARASERFTGEAPEFRPSLRSGHIPGAKNLPYDKLLNDDGTLKTTDQIREAFSAAGVSLTKPIVTSCGSGITASVLALALATIGRDNIAVYDGSWSEWGGNQKLPIEVGT